MGAGDEVITRSPPGSLIVPLREVGAGSARKPRLWLGSAAAGAMDAVRSSPASAIAAPVRRDLGRTGEAGIESSTIGRVGGEMPPAAVE